jgi:hypothetical protein
MKRRKYLFTLMEVMIGLSLLSLILGLIFSTLYQETILQRRIHKIQQETMSKMDLQQRLDKIFSNISPTDPILNHRSMYSSDNQESLFVFFDNGIDPDPAFSGIVQGLISLDETKLLLHYYIDDKPARTMILKENIQSLAFEFMMQTSDGISTLATWDKKINFSPLYVKMILNKEEEYVFWVNRECEPTPLKGKQ